ARVCPPSGWSRRGTGRADSSLPTPRPGAGRRTGGWSCTSCPNCRGGAVGRSGGRHLLTARRVGGPQRIVFSVPQPLEHRMKARWLPSFVATGLLTASPPDRLSAQSSPRPFQATDYYKLTSVGEPRPAPDGRRIAFVVTTVVEDNDRRHSEIWMAPGGEAFQVRGVHALPLFSGDGKWLLYSWRGPEPDSMKKDSWRSRVSPSAITRGPDPKRFGGRV